jgi:hypothetical protein
MVFRLLLDLPVFFTRGLGFKFGHCLMAVEGCRRYRIRKGKRRTAEGVRGVSMHSLFVGRQCGIALLSIFTIFEWPPSDRTRFFVLEIRVMPSPRRRESMPAGPRAPQMS